MIKDPPPPGTPPSPLTFDQMDNEARLQYLKKITDQLSNAVGNLNAMMEIMERHDHKEGKIVFYAQPRVK